ARQRNHDRMAASARAAEALVRPRSYSWPRYARMWRWSTDEIAPERPMVSPRYSANPSSSRRYARMVCADALRPFSSVKRNCAASDSNSVAACFTAAPPIPDEPLGHAPEPQLCGAFHEDDVRDAHASGAPWPHGYRPAW